MRGYTTTEVASLLGLSLRQVRSYARAGFLNPQRGPRAEYRFTFQDMVLLRTASELLGARVPARTVRSALARLKDQLPTGRSLTGVRIAAQGSRVVVRDGSRVWNPESGQLLFDFDVSELAKKVAPLTRQVAREAHAAEEAMGAEDWYRLGCELELFDVRQARDAYRRALELDVHHVDAHVNLGRLLHESRELLAAEAHYRLALAARPGEATAQFNLGVVLEDLGRPEEAAVAYEGAIRADPNNADAYYNLAQVCEALGRQTAALRHLKTYRSLVER